MEQSLVLTPEHILALQSFFGEELMPNSDLGRYTVMQVGGPADYLVEINEIKFLADSVEFLWKNQIPFLMLGGGANVLISDKGIRSLVLVNKAKNINFTETPEGQPIVQADSGARFGSVARRTGAKGLAGLEWAAGIPGTVGGAVVGNAGAHGSDVANDLYLAEILHHKSGKAERDSWSADDFGYRYRSSILKRGEVEAVVLKAAFKLERSTPDQVKAEITRIAERRKSTQPQGASLGSMFKNPGGDYAGRLIEAAGLKGTRQGGAEISPVHANFFMNRGKATASDIYHLIQLARDTVLEKFGVELELEILMIGEWDED
jgi:UDP-N-acetylmuramate dehydrogenase